MRFTTLALAAFAVAAQANQDVYIYTTCYSTRTVERVVATSYITANRTQPTATGPTVAAPTYPAGNTTVAVVAPQPTSPGVTNGASVLGVQAAGLAAAVGAIAAFLA